jgi:hypothetical protein
MKDRTNPPVPDARKLSFKSNTKLLPPGNRVQVPPRNAPGDPTVSGATLTVYNSAGSGEKMVLVLPAAGWSAYDTAPTPKGYRYKSGGPITQVTVKADYVKVKGSRSALTYSLNEPSQGRMALRLQLGSQAAW